MSLGDSYATLAELRSRVGITDAAFTGEDSKLTASLAAASRGVEKACGRQFNDAGSTSARVYYPDGSYCTMVEDFSTTTGLVVKSDTAGDGTFATTWASTDVQAEPLNGIVDGETGWPFWVLRAVGNNLFPCYWVNTRAPLQVTARWGWTAVPTPVKEGCLILAEEIYKLKDSPFGVGGYGQFGIIRARQNPMVAERIAPYILDLITEHVHPVVGKARLDDNHRERLARGRRDNVRQLYQDRAAEREADVEKLRAVMSS